MRILVVDDELACARILSRYLQRLGHSTVTAVCSDDALDMLDGGFGAVVTDIDMPGMNGVDLAREIRNRLGPIPIAFCTGSDREHDHAKLAAQLGPVLPKATSLEAAREVMSALAA
jgi:CheY-like chemotaxis protein